MFIPTKHDINNLLNKNTNFYEDTNFVNQNRSGGTRKLTISQRSKKHRKNNRPIISAE